MTHRLYIRNRFLADPRRGVRSRNQHWHTARNQHIQAEPARLKAQSSGGGQVSAGDPQEAHPW